MARLRKPSTTRTPRAPRTPQWWDRPLGAVLVLVGLALVVLILANAGSSAANLSKYVLGAAFVFVILVGIGLAFLLQSRAAVMWVSILWIVPAAFFWVGLEHWLDWHAFYSSGGSRRNRVTTPTGAKIRGTFFMFLGVAGFSLWVGVVRGLAKRRGAGVQTP